ncbi:MAG: tetratricopeptide repeat protein [Pseudomonadales bacterium]|nr:tetratricopeptide repeat protein [Pseudomonadales bacterium]
MHHARRTLAAALGLFRAGRYAECARTLEPLCAAGEPAGALSLAAMALSLAGEAQAATRCFERHLARQPADAASWNNFGNHLRAYDAAHAIACYGRAIALKPDFGDARFNLALLHNERREHRAALAALAPGTRAACTPREHALAASLHLRLYEWDAAVPHLETLLARNPADARTRLNLAVAQRMRGDASQALRTLTAAGDAAPEALRFERASILLETGGTEAARTLFEGIVAHNPANIAAHEALDKIHFETGEPGRVGQSLAQAFARSGDPALATALALQYERIGARERALAIIERLAPAHRSVEARRLRARLLVAAGRTAEGGREFAACLELHPGERGASLDYARFLMLENRAPEAAQLLEHALAQHPEDQLLLANLGTAWKLCADARHDALFDTARLVRVYSLFDFGLDAPFFAELAALLRDMHLATHHPLDQSLRGGTQTVGNLLGRREAPIVRLRRAIEAVLADYLAQLAPDARHPFLRRRPERWRFAGSWSVLLHSEGFHVPHTHGQGWLSSALYVALPGGTQGREGWLEFGRSDLRLPPAADPPGTALEPRVGRLVLFPSYLWHGTVAFSAPGERLTVAFDVGPAD